MSKLRPIIIGGKPYFVPSSNESSPVGFIAVILLIILMITSCSVTRVTYGDVSLMDNNGNLIKQYPNSLLEVQSESSGYYCIKTGGGIIFTDSTGVTHYTHGGIILIDNINTERLTPSTQDPDELEEEFQKLKAELKERESYFNVHKSTMTKGEIESYKKGIKILKKQISNVESILYPIEQYD